MAMAPETVSAAGKESSHTRFREILIEKLREKLGNPYDKEDCVTFVRNALRGMQVDDNLFRYFNNGGTLANYYSKKGGNLAVNSGADLLKSNALENGVLLLALKQAKGVYDLEERMKEDASDMAIFVSSDGKCSTIALKEAKDKLGSGRVFLTTHYLVVGKKGSSLTAIHSSLIEGKAVEVGLAEYQNKGGRGRQFLAIDLAVFQKSQGFFTAAP